MCFCLLCVYIHQCCQPVFRNHSDDIQGTMWLLRFEFTSMVFQGLPGSLDTGVTLIVREKPCGFWNLGALQVMFKGPCGYQDSGIDNPKVFEGSCNSQK